MLLVAHGMRRLNWYLLGSFAVLTAVALLSTGLSTNLWTMPHVLIAIASILMLRWLDRPLDGRVARMLDAMEGCTLFCAISLVGAIACYPMAKLSTGFIDAELAAADRMLGFDWLAFYAFTVASPFYQFVTRWAYMSLGLIPAILIFVLAWRGQMAAVHRLVLVYAIALFLTVICFPLFPSRGAFEYYLPDVVPYVPITSLGWSEIIENLRGGRMIHIPADDLMGLINLPSFHTASGLLFIRAAWAERAWRPVLIPLNALMLIATPIEGAHYLVDLLGGVAVTVAAILLTRAVEMRVGRIFARHVPEPVLQPA